MTQTTLLVFARGAGMIFRAPGFSHPSVPPPVRAGLALALAFAVAPHVPVVTYGGATFTLALASETLLGAAIGTGASLLYDAAYYAGRTIDDYVGVRGTVPNANVTSAQAFGRLWSSVFLAGFFLLDGYVPVVRAFDASFAAVPPGGAIAAGAWAAFAAALPATIVRAALLIASPALAVTLTVQVALASVARVVPRLANFSLAFPVVFAVAIVVALTGIPLFAPLSAHPWLVLPFGPAP
ncbi:MAG: flagellar biosynthetic protein FliR [Candidatus Lustribacter sp.]|jgi:flagellar biosynthetic protein FliR